MNAGSPKPQLSWRRVGGELPAGVEIRDGLMVIPTAHLADAGLYECVATNRAGEVFTQVQLHVTGELLIDYRYSTFNTD